MLNNSLLVDDADDNEVPAPVPPQIKEHFEEPGPSTDPSTNIPSCLPKDQLMPQELLPQDTPANQCEFSKSSGFWFIKGQKLFTSRISCRY